MRVKDLMKRDVRTITPDSGASGALDLMRSNRIRHLVVVEKHIPVGVVSDRDLLVLSEMELKNKTVNEVMTEHPATIDPEEPISRAANQMRGRSIGCLPVVEEHRLVGIVTTSDLLRVVADGGGTRERVPVRDGGAKRKTARV